MKNNFYIIIIIVFVAVGILACILTQHVGTTETIGNTTEPISEVSTNNTNSLNENSTSEDENTNTNVTVENTVETVTPEVTPENTDTVPITNNQVYESNTDLGSTEKKQEAINIVKSMWGEDSTVTYRCDSITSDGKYIVAVVSLETASVKNYFRVDLTTKTAEVDY